MLAVQQLQIIENQLYSFPQLNVIALDAGSRQEFWQFGRGKGNQIEKMIHIEDDHQLYMQQL